MHALRTETRESEMSLSFAINVIEGWRLLRKLVLNPIWHRLRHESR